MFKQFLLAIVLFASIVSATAQETCSSTSRMPHEWLSHRNWGLGDNLGRSRIYNSSTGAVTSFGSARSYEGTASASDHLGNFLFFANGRILYDAAGATVYNGLLTGNEGGNTTGSAAQGIMSVRHPLNPDHYYFITTDDAITGTTLGLNYAVVHKDGTMITTSTRLGSFRTTEGIAATWHENGIDIWITVTQSGSTNIRSYLLRCDGFETDPAISPAISAVGISTTGNGERGGVAFSHDSQQFAVGMGGTTLTDKVRLYDFDNATGLMTYNKGIGSALSIYAAYDLQFSPDDSRVLASTSYGNVFSLNIANATGTEIAASTASHSAIEIGADGSLYRATLVGHGGPLNKLAGNLNNGSNLTVTTITNTYVARGLNTMFLPPSEEPDIEEVGPYCNTDPAVDLNTTWICAGTNAENPSQNPLAYIGTGITNRATGIFDPAVAGEGTHEIIFEYCSVNDTIWIVVNNCVLCEVDVDDVEPEICVGETYTLDDLVLDGSADGVWTIDSMPSGTLPVITPGTDTVFDASNLSVADGTYKLLYTVTDGAEVCYDSVYIIVNPLPEPDLGNDTAICINDPAVVFDPGSFVSYSWEPNSEITQTISIDVAGEYKVTVTDANSCSARDSVTLTVNSLPTLDLGDDEEICIGDAAVTFDAGTYVSYAWQPNSEITQTISTSDADEYIVTVIDANGCEANDTVVLTVNPLPTPDLGDDEEICAGDAAVTFDAGTYVSYVWQLNSEITQTISTDVDGEYIVTVTDANGCEVNDTVVLTVNPLLTPDLGDDEGICIGDAAVTFDAGTYVSYAWQPNSEITQTISTDVDGEYVVTVTDGNGCEANDTVVLTVNPLPTPDLGDDEEICIGDAAVTFDAGTYVSYAWQSNSEITQTISTDVDDEYIVTVTDGNGCEANDTVVLTVNPLPIPDLGDDEEICIVDAAVTFDAGTYASYAWQPNSEITQTISTDVDGEYVVTVTDGNGCEANDTVVLTINPLPTPALGDDEEICIGDAAITFDAGTYASYSWQPNSEITQTISTDVDGEYIVTVTDGNGCEANDTVVLTVNPLSTPNLGNDTAICAGDPEMTFDAGTYASYAWKPNSETTQTIVTDVDGEYIVTVTDANGCEANDTVVLMVNPLPTPDLGVDTAICIGDAAVTLDAGTYASYAWIPNSETTQIITTNVDGDYAVEVTDVNGCKASDTINLKVNDLPVIDLGSDITICPGSLVTLDATSNLANYIWNDGTMTQTIDVTDVNAGVFNVLVTDTNGCSTKDTVEVIVADQLYVNLSSDTAFCNGNILTVDAGITAGATYAWQPTWESTQVIDITTSGTYSVLVTDSMGCSGEDTIIVTVNLNPTVDLGPDVRVCPDFHSLFTVGSVWSSVLWNDASTGDDLTVNTVGTYYVDVIDVNGCTATDTADFKFFSGATIDLGSDITICPGTTASFDAGTFASYTWQDATGNQTYTGNIEEVVYVDVMDADGCIASDTAEIFMATSLPINLGNDTAVCDGETVMLDAGYPVTGYTFSWNTGETTPTITVNSTGIYGVEVEDITGCSGSDSIVVIVNLNPTVDLGPDVTVCPDFDSLFTVGSSWTTVLWNDASTAGDLTVNTAGTYYVDVTDANGCSATDTADFNFFRGATVDLGSDITICPGTTASFDAGTFTTYTWQDATGNQTYVVDVASVVYVDVLDFDGCIASDTAEIFMAISLPVDLGNDTAVCEGETVTISSGYPSVGYTFLWNTGETTNEITKGTVGVYGVLVQDVNGCTGGDTMNLAINLLPVVDLGIDKAICEGMIESFDAGTRWSTIIWNTLETSQVIDVDSTANYIVSVTDINGCEASDTALLTVNINPIVALGNDQTVCPGSKALFDAGIYVGYVWQDGTTTNSYSSSTEEQVYVTVTDVNGCIGRDTAEIFVRNALLVDLGPDLDTCAGNTIDLLSGYSVTFNTFVWNTLETTDNITVNASGTYFVDVTDKNGCTGNDTVEIIVHANPIVDLGNNQSICDGDTTTFDAAIFTSYVWSDFTVNQTLTKWTSGTYSVVVTDVNGCVGIDEVDLIINANPTVSIGNDVEVCPGNDVTFSTVQNGFASYVWQDLSTDETFTALDPQEVSVLVTDGNGCIAVDTAELTNLPALDVVLPIDQTLCEGETFEITIPGFNPNTHTYLWSNGSMNSSITVGTSDSYNVFVSNGGGCAGYDEIDVTVNPNPIPVVKDTSVCEGEVATMTTGNYVSYSWSSRDNTQTINVTSEAVYTVTVVDTNNCSGSGSGVFSINVKPVIPAYADRVACEGEVITLTPQLPLGTYTWKPNGETTATLDIMETGTHEVVVMNGNGCKDSINIFASYNSIPSIDLGPDVIICEGESAIIGNNSESGTVTWNIGLVSDSLETTVEGIFIATITDVNGCMNQDEIEVNVSVNPIPLATSDTVVCMQEIGELALNVVASSRDEVLWSNGESSNDIIIDIEGTYYVTATNADGCTGMDTVVVDRKCISEIYVPNAFTPDYDGINDGFGPQGVNITNFDFYVFNRWGEQIFHSTSMDDKWDGKVNGNIVPIDVYVWKIFYRTEEDYGGLKPRQKVGTVTVLR